MKNTLTILALMLVITLNWSCKKELATSDNELVGTWTNDSGTEIQINANGKGYSHYDDGFSYKKIDGKVKVENETIIFKAFGVKESYKIDKRPYKSKTNVTVMGLNDDTYRLK